MECLGDIVNPLTIFELDKTASSFLVDYLSRRGKRTKICPVYSKWIKILNGIPQDSVLDAISFNIFINDWFFLAFESEICNYADDNPLYSCAQVPENILRNFKYNLHNILKYESQTRKV